MVEKYFKLEKKDKDFIENKKKEKQEKKKVKDNIKKYANWSIFAA